MSSTYRLPDERLLELITPERARETNPAARLPLHAAAAYTDSEAVIRRLIEVHPEAARSRTAILGELPLHEAARCTSSPDVILALIEAYPDGVREANRARSPKPLRPASASQAADFGCRSHTHTRAVSITPAPRLTRRRCTRPPTTCFFRSSARYWRRTPRRCTWRKRLQPIPAPHRGVSPSCITAIRTWPRCCTSARRGSAGSLASLASSPLPGDARVASRPRSERASPGPPSLVQWHPCSAIVQLYDDARDCARTRSYHHGVLHES
uniref:Uncharacterized protein n=1 Tax=Emiliania huxleyi (strain CCMP1516) TaxID=280463 RepID=A0A0D3J9G5_EMIH1